jgi:hypothetical protein
MTDNQNTPPVASIAPGDFVMGREVELLSRQRESFSEEQA